MDAWIIWLVAAAALGVGEMHARGFFLAPLAAGALVVVATLFWRRSRLFAATSAAQAKAETAP